MGSGVVNEVSVKLGMPADVVKQQNTKDIVHPNALLAYLAVRNGRIKSVLNLKIVIAIACEILLTYWLL